MGTITFHPWPVRSDDVDHPDELRLDLDPQPGTDFADAVRVAGVARELLADLGAAGVPCALVTMSYLSFVEPMLDALPPDTFAAVVTGDAVERGKPYPDPYLKGARLLGVAPGDCLAIEDSNVGARSAEAAGCTVLCVPNHVPILEAPGRVFADSLVGLTAANLPARPAAI